MVVWNTQLFCIAVIFLSRRWVETLPVFLLQVAFLLMIELFSSLFFYNMSDENVFL